MYILDSKQPTSIQKTSFSELKLNERDIEEILRKNIDMLCEDEDEASMLVVGQQVKNEKNGRSDLIAIDQHGDLVLIEIKRDKTDVEKRKEAFEFQAIRYAASCATIKSVEELIQEVFVPYIERHSEEFQYPELTKEEIAKNKLENYFKSIKNIAFNEHQRIILVASEFDEQTLSAVAWLNNNHVDISCYQICPYKLDGRILIDVNRILPVKETEDFYVGIAKRSGVEKEKKKDTFRTRVSLPKIDAMIKWGVVLPGDIVVAKGTSEEAKLLENGQVETVRGEMSMQQWLKGVYGWSSVQTYAFAELKRTGKLLMDIREEYMEKMEAADTQDE